MLPNFQKRRLLNNSCDDGDIEALIASSKKSDSSLTMDLVQLDGKVKQATQLLNSALAEIVECKPIFDNEKLKLIKLENEIEQLYNASTTEQKQLVLELQGCLLNESTQFPEWNDICGSINRLIKKLSHKSILEDVPLQTIPIGQSTNKKSNTTVITTTNLIYGVGSYICSLHFAICFMFTGLIVGIFYVLIAYVLVVLYNN